MSSMSFRAKFPDRDGVPDSPDHKYEVSWQVYTSKEKEPSGKARKEVHWNLYDRYGETVDTGTFTFGTWIPRDEKRIGFDVVKAACESSGLISGLIYKGGSGFGNKLFGV